MHQLGIVHGHLKAVCPFLHLHFVQVFKFLQKNVLVDANRNACVAGLGIAFHSFNMPGGGIHWYFHGLAPELVDHSLPASTRLPTTMNSDVYAFGVLAWEVSPTLECLMYELLNGSGIFLRFSLGKYHSPKWGTEELPRWWWKVVDHPVPKIPIFPMVFGR
jgi:serine/threonine protein kinase